MCLTIYLDSKPAESPAVSSLTIAVSAPEPLPLQVSLAESFNSKHHHHHHHHQQQQQQEEVLDHNNSASALPLSCNLKGQKS